MDIPAHKGEISVLKFRSAIFLTFLIVSVTTSMYYIQKDSELTRERNIKELVSDVKFDKENLFNVEVKINKFLKLEADLFMKEYNNVEECRKLSEVCTSDFISQYVILDNEGLPEREVNLCVNVLSYEIERTSNGYSCLVYYEITNNDNLIESKWRVLELNNNLKVSSSKDFIQY